MEEIGFILSDVVKLSVLIVAVLVGLLLFRKVIQFLYCWDDLEHQEIDDKDFQKYLDRK